MKSMQLIFSLTCLITVSNLVGSQAAISPGALRASQRILLGMAVNSNDMQRVQQQLSGTKYTPDELGQALINNINISVSIARRLIEAGLNIDYVDADGRSLLHMACGDPGNIYTARLLLENKAAVNPRTRDGKTPLDIAIKSVRPDTVKLLLEHKATTGGADRDGTDHGDNPPIGYFCLPAIPNKSEKIKEIEHLLKAAQSASSALSSATILSSAAAASSAPSSSAAGDEKS